MICQDLNDLPLAQARFRALVTEWDLCRRQVAALLGVAEERLGLDLVPASMGSDAERRLRLLLQVRELLPVILSDGRDAPLWVRGAFSPANQATPLEMMTSGADGLREVRAALAQTGR